MEAMAEFNYTNVVNNKTYASKAECCRQCRLTLEELNRLLASAQVRIRCIPGGRPRFCVDDVFIALRSLGV